MLATYDPRHRYLTGLGAPRRRASRRRLFGLGAHYDPRHRYLTGFGQDGGSDIPTTLYPETITPDVPTITDISLLPGSGVSIPGTYVPGTIQPTDATIPSTLYSPPSSSNLTAAQLAQLIPGAIATTTNLATALNQPQAASWFNTQSGLGVSNGIALLAIGGIAVLALLSSRRS